MQAGDLDIFYIFQDQRIVEDCRAFGIGTAATISHIAVIGYEGTDYELPAVENRPISNRLLDSLTKIKLGQEEDRFGWIRKIG